MMSSHDKCACWTGDAHYVDQQFRSETQNSFARHCVLDVSPNSSRSEWGSQFLLETVFVPSWFSGSSWFRLWFRGLSPFLSSFLSLLCLLKKGGCSIMISCFLLVPALVPGLVSLLVSLLVSSFFAQKTSLFRHDFLFLAGSGSGSGACLPSCLPFCLPSWSVLSLLSLLKKGGCSIMISCFLLVLVPGLVSLLVSLLVFSFFAQKRRLFRHDFLFLAGSGSGSGACLPSCLPFCLPSWSVLSLLSLLKKGGCSIMISCFLLVLVPGLVSLLVSLLVFSFFAQKRRLFRHDFLFLAGSGSGSGACLPSCLPFCLPSWSVLPLLSLLKKGGCSIMISCFLLVLVPGLVSLLVSLLVFSFFAQKRRLFRHDFLFLAGSGSGACLPSCLPSCLP